MKLCAKEISNQHIVKDMWYAFASLRDVDLLLYYSRYSIFKTILSFNPPSSMVNKTNIQYFHSLESMVQKFSRSHSNKTHLNDLTRTGGDSG